MFSKGIEFNKEGFLSNCKMLLKIKNLLNSTFVKEILKEIHFQI